MLKSPKVQFIPVICGLDRLAAVYHEAVDVSDMAAVIVVGGPQYRVGSHRMFVAIARRLAENGVNALRFDCRGMGDSDGDFQTFETLGEDIRCAIDSVAAFNTRIALVGLCDGASAVASYAYRDARVAALVLINPWVHTERAEAQARLSNYYAKRLFRGSTWIDLLSGRINVTQAAGAMIGVARRRFRKVSGHTHVERMLIGLRSFQGDVAILLSSDDTTAQEFEGLSASSPDWRRLLREPRFRIVRCQSADHTFSLPEHLDWLTRAVVACTRRERLY